jgi:hypothetical protein
MNFLILKLIMACILICIGTYGTFLFRNSIIEIADFKKKDKVAKSSVLRENFGEIVTLIESQLASDKTQLKRNEKIKNIKTDEYINVPMLLTSNIGPHEIKIAIEMFDENKKIDSEKLLSILGKYDAVGIITIVIVSKSGFEDDVYKRAKFLNNLELISFQEAKTTDWSKVISKLTNVKIHHFMLPTLSKVTTVFPIGTPFKEGVWEFKECQILKPSGVTITTDEWVQDLLWNQELLLTVEKLATKDGSYTIDLTAPMKGFFIISPNKDKLPLISILLKAKFQIFSENLEFVKALYGVSQLAYTQTEKFNNSILITVTEDKDEEAKIGIKIKKGSN